MVLRKLDIDLSIREVMVSFQDAEWDGVMEASTWISVEGLGNQAKMCDRVIVPVTSS